MKTIEEMQQAFIGDFNELGDWFLQYEYLLRLTASMESVSESERREENRIKGCQAKVWVVAACDGPRLRIRGDSDALIVKGMLAVVIQLLNNRTPDEIMKADIRFLEETDLRSQISTDRFHGMQTVVAGIKEYARDCSRKPAP